MRYTVTQAPQRTLYVAPGGAVLMTVEAIRHGMWQVTRPTGEISTRNSRDGAEALAAQFLRGRKP
jgi:hypothetical protein